MFSILPQSGAPKLMSIQFTRYQLVLGISIVRRTHDKVYTDTINPFSILTRS